MTYFTYPWKEGEFEDICNQIYTCPCCKSNDDRFIGPLLPFLGGVLIGGLFLPRPTPFPPYGPAYPPVAYVQPIPYSTDVATYSVPTSSPIKK